MKDYTNFKYDKMNKIGNRVKEIDGILKTIENKI